MLNEILWFPYSYRFVFLGGGGGGETGISSKTPHFSTSHYLGNECPNSKAGHPKQVIHNEVLIDFSIRDYFKERV